MSDGVGAFGEEDEGEEIDWDVPDGAPVPTGPTGPVPAATRPPDAPVAPGPTPAPPAMPRAPRGPWAGVILGALAVGLAAWLGKEVQ